MRTRTAGEGRFLRLSPAIAVAVVLFVGGGFSYGSTGAKLIASVDACQVIRADGGTQQLRRGVHVVVVRDTSRTRYFALRGLGVKRSTSARFIGTVKWTVRLHRATYRFRCGSARDLSGILPVG